MKIRMRIAMQLVKCNEPTRQRNTRAHAACERVKTAKRWEEARASARRLAALGCAVPFAVGVERAAVNCSVRLCSIHAWHRLVLVPTWMLAVRGLAGRLDQHNTTQRHHFPKKAKTSDKRRRGRERRSSSLGEAHWVVLIWDASSLLGLNTRHRALRLAERV